MLPDSPASIVVVIDRMKNPTYAHDRVEAVGVALRHFTKQTRWMPLEDLDAPSAAAAGAVVYLGEQADARLSARSLDALKHARRLVVSRYHLDQLREAGVAFAHVDGGKDIAVNAATAVRYGDEILNVDQQDYLDLSVRAPARVLATIGAGRDARPFAVAEGSATFINGVLDFGGSATDRSKSSMVAVADILNDALGATPLASGQYAMLRLEDVSVQTPARRFATISEYLESAHVGYGIGLIPDQLIQGQTLATLRDDPELVDALRRAQAHGGRIILHGLHHSFHSAEDFEFWDAANNRPLAGDSTAVMHAKIAEGLGLEQSLGFDPHIWETPHYAASPQDYAAIDEVFPLAWELRRPLGWLPWALWADQYGERTLPENLGYVSVDGTQTVDMMLERARKLRLCRGCIAAGFLHPSTVPVAEVKRFVEGMRALGYEFIDPLSFEPHT